MTVAWLAAAMIIAGVALFVAAPLTGVLLPARRKASSEFDRERLEHERGLAVQGLRELEFDREMGKLSDLDYQALHVDLERRALAAMAALDQIDSQPARTKTSPVRRIESARAAVPRTQGTPSRSINFCPQCGARSIDKANFCGECGVSLRPRDNRAS